MSEVKLVAASIVKFLKQQLNGSALNNDMRESVEVSVQCLETAFEVNSTDAASGLDLLELVKNHLNKTTASADAKAQAEQLKNEGNESMKKLMVADALEKYTNAIVLDPFNAVYYCNRAAAYFKMGDHEAAVADCTAALAIQPDYSKAHGRLGLALTALDRHREARTAYARASELDPENESYRTNLRLADERLVAEGERPPINLGGLLENNALMNMATQMLSDPNMQNLISGLMNNSTSDGPALAANSGGMDALLEAGQVLAQQMQRSNPDLVEQLRRQVGNPRPPGPNPQTPPQ